MTARAGSFIEMVNDLVADSAPIPGGSFVAEDDGYVRIGGYTRIGHLGDFRPRYLTSMSGDFWVVATLGDPLQPIGLRDAFRLARGLLANAIRTHLARWFR